MQKNPIEYLPKGKPNTAKALDISSIVKRVRGKKIGRNDPCICGSGNKFKRCCLDKLRR
jgi:uncharacterized protein YecA (UPF0149 family)